MQGLQRALINLKNSHIKSNPINIYIYIYIYLQNLGKIKLDFAIEIQFSAMYFKLFILKESFIS